MTPEKQRIAIAEECGWGDRLKLENQWDARTVIYKSSIPNYPSDLNAMHEAVRIGIKTLEQWSDYLDTLYRIVQDPHICPTTHAIAYVEATAPQRAEAFLRTIGKWEE